MICWGSFGASEAEPLKVLEVPKFGQKIKQHQASYLKLVNEEQLKSLGPRKLRSEKQYEGVLEALKRAERLLPRVDPGLELSLIHI